MTATVVLILSPTPEAGAVLWQAAMITATQHSDIAPRRTFAARPLDVSSISSMQPMPLPMATPCIGGRTCRLQRSDQHDKHHQHHRHHGTTTETTTTTTTTRDTNNPPHTSSPRGRARTGGRLRRYPVVATAPAHDVLRRAVHDTPSPPRTNTSVNYDARAQRGMARTSCDGVRDEQRGLCARILLRHPV